MPRVKDQGPKPFKVISEHTRTKKAGGGSRDKAKFNDGAVRYDWDVYTDAQGDKRGRVGLGHNDGRNDVYARVDFNEDTGHLKGSVAGERKVNENLDVRATAGRYADGDNFGEVGATIKNERGSLGLDVGGNERTGRVFGRLKGRYKVGEDTTLRGSFSDDNKKSPIWKLGARHRLGTGNFVDGEGGVSRKLGDYMRGEWKRNDGKKTRDRLKVGVSEKKGWAGSYEGRQDFENAYLKEKASYTDGRLKAEMKGRTKTEGGHIKGVSHFEHRDDGRWSGDVGGELKEGANTYGGRLRKDLSGTKKVRGIYGREITETLDGKVTVNVDSKGRWDVATEAEKDLGDGLSVREKVKFDHRGVRTYTHGVKKEFSEHRARVGAEVEHDSQGKLKISADAGITTEGGERHEADIAWGRAKDGKKSAHIGYDFNDRDGFKAAGRIGHRGDERLASLKLKREHENKRGSEEFALDWSSKKGLKAKGTVTRKFGEDTTASASVSRNLKDGTVAAEAGISTMAGEDDDIKLRVGMTASTKDRAIGVDVSAARIATAEKLGFGAEVGFERSTKKDSLDLGGSLSSKGLFGLDETAKLGLGGSVDVTKKAVVGKERGAIGKLRAEALEGEPEGSGFVRYGMKAKAKADVGFKIPIGFAYADTGYKHGRSYEVEFTRLEADPKAGKRPSMAELKVPEGADGLLAMKTGESFAIKGATTHAVRGGGGVGTSIGASVVGSVDARVGAVLTYAIAGNTRTEVTRGGDESARMVVKASDSRTKGGGIEINVGLNPNLPKIEGIGPVGDLATGLAKGMVKKWISVGGEKGPETMTGDERLLDARLDLSHPEARAAYERAMKGDWTDLERLDKADHPGVTIDKSIISDIKEETEKLNVHGLGMSFEKLASERLKDSEVTYKGREFTVESDLDKNTRVKDGWFVDREFAVQDFTRTVEAKDGGALNRRKPVEHWLGWANSKTDSFTSKEEVHGQLKLARYVARDDMPKELKKFDKKVAKLKDHRKLWIGPRNELRKTEVRTEIILSDEALDRLSAKSSDDIWAALSNAEVALGGKDPASDWTDAAKRTTLASGMDGFDHRVGLDGATNLYERSAYRQADVFVDRLEAAGQLPEEERNDAIREALASRPRDVVAIGALVELLGRDVVDMRVKVDSNAGRKGKQFDLDFKLRGDAYDVQKTVFGANL